MNRWLATTGPDVRRNTLRAFRVLLADDHKIMREGLVALLEVEPDIQVVAEAGDGQEAVELTHEHQPDVVVMDVTMPVMTGIEATQRIISELPRTRVIGLSVHQRGDRAEAYLTKDGPSDDLIAAIRGELPAT